ncbi:MAG TPA: hypothetical protein VF732_08755, partial [Nitrospira sp.]
PKLLAAYHDDAPDPTVHAQRVAFGTSGHRGSAFKRSFNEQHILATVQAIVEYRHAKERAAHCTSGSILMRSPNRRSTPRSKSWMAMAWRS